MIRGWYNLPPPFTEKEIRSICRKLKCKKAPGHDEISAEYFKYTGEKFINILTNLYSRISVIEKIPMHFKYGIIVSIPKGDKDKCMQDNYRGITLLQTIYKKDI